MINNKLLWAVLCISCILPSKYLLSQCEPDLISNNQQWDCYDEPWLLELSDDFDGTDLDYGKWRKGQPWGNYSLQNQYDNFCDDNVIVSNGTLKLRTKYYPDNTYFVTLDPNQPPSAIMSDGKPNYRYLNYTAADIFSNYRYDYGRFQIRCKLPSGTVYWPAFWLNFMPPNEYNEIDVFEFHHGSTTDQYTAIHHNFTTGNGGCSESHPGPDYSASMHVFTVDWTPYEIVFYTDGVVMRVYHRYMHFNGLYFDTWLDCSDLPDAGSPIGRRNGFPDDPMNIIANTAYDKDPLHAPDPNTPDSYFEIDYIKYWKRVPCTGLVQINDLSQFDIDSPPIPEGQVYNIKTGAIIEVNGSMTIPAFNQLELCATNTISIEPGFDAVKKSNLLLQIDPNLCVSDQRLGMTTQDKPSNEASLPNPETIVIYPNPSNRTFQISFANQSVVQVQVTDMLGRVVYSSGNIEGNSLTLDLNTEPNGIYMLSIISPEGIKTERLVKQ